MQLTIYKLNSIHFFRLIKGNIFITNGGQTIEPNSLTIVNNNNPHHYIIWDSKKILQDYSIILILWYKTNN